MSVALAQASPRKRSERKSGPSTKNPLTSALPHPGWTGTCASRTPNRRRPLPKGYRAAERFGTDPIAASEAYSCRLAIDNNSRMHVDAHQ